MQTLTRFLSGLPGLRPIKARRAILDGSLLSEEDRSDLHRRDLGLLDTVVEVGPDAAIAILAAYRSASLPMRKGATPAAAPEVEAYVARADELRKQAAAHRRRDGATKDPSLIVESDLTDHRLIDRVFVTNIGLGSGSMLLAGTTVRKTLVGYKSNSGKSTGWLVRFDWVGSDGKPGFSQSVPPEAGNRRNDPNRNWGLYE